jgi:putative ABC transport system permease protein
MSAPDQPRGSCDPVRPPRAAAWLLRAILPADGAEPILGDLEELLLLRAPRVGVRRARLWYWQQAIGLLASRPAWQPMRRQMPVRRTTAMAALVQDVSYAFRALSKQIGFTATAVLTLALGIGANLAIFSLVYAVLIRPLPFRDPGELMLVQMLSPDPGAPGTLHPTFWSYPKYVVLRDQQQVFSGTALFASRDWSLTNTTTPERVQGEVAEASYFRLLGVEPRLGRLFGSDESRMPGPPVAVLSEGLWQRRFGGDPNVLGRTIRLDGQPFTIIGVAPAGFRGLLGQADVWRPITTDDPGDLSGAFSHSYHQVARRKPGITVEAAAAATRVLGARVNEAYPDTGEQLPWSARAVAIDDERIDPLLRRSVFVLLGAVALVLLIGCVNLANLTLARGVARRREVGIRLALGASRLRIARQFLTETLVLSLAGTAVGVLVAFGAVRLASTWMPDVRNILRGPQAGLTRIGVSMLGVDETMVAVAVGLALLTALLVGLGPAWQAARGDLTTAVRAGSAGSISPGFRGLTFRNALVVGEIALALVMLVSAGLMLKSTARLSATDLGFRPDRLLTFRVALTSEAYTPDRRTQFVEQLLARLKARPEIEGAAYSFCAPIQGGCNGTTAKLLDRPPAPRGAEPMVGVNWASSDYLSTLGVRLVRGRWFTDQDRAGQPKVVVVNETAARRFWNDADPIGKRISLGQGGFRDGAEIVGVVGDVRYSRVEIVPGPETYIPVLQSPRPFGVFFIRSRVASATLLPVVREQLAALDSDLPMIDVKTMDERYGEATWRTWTIGTLLTLFAALAVVLALVGIFGVLAQGVAQRTREIGVRMALGAERRDILRLVLGRASLMAAVGVAAGLVASYFAMRLLTTLLYEVRPDDPTVLVALSALLFAVALAASYVPAHRATRVDPLETLRAE